MSNRSFRCAQIALGIGLSLFVAIGCGSRPGFEGDFAELPPPDAIDQQLTDEEMEEARIEAEKERVKQLEELQALEMERNVRSDVNIDPFEAPPDYVITFEDELQLRFAQQAEMNSPYTVRPDGKVSFDLIGEIPVAGHTPKELRETLEELYSVYLRNPSINVVVKQFQTQRFYVLGEVERPGMYHLQNTTTVTQAIALAGGWTNKSRPEDLMVVRKSTDQTPFAFRVNLKRIMNEREVRSDLYLHHQDIVYVPKGRIASAADFMTNLFGVIEPPVEAAWRVFWVSDWASKN